jgi:hypothetical protein
LSSTAHPEVSTLVFQSSRDPRAHLQNGFWGLKVLILFAATVGSFFIPHGSFGPTWCKHFCCCWQILTIGQKIAILFSF